MEPPNDDRHRTDVDLSDYKELFLEQAALFLTTLQSSLSQLRTNPRDPEALREAQRATHTLKGMASTMQYDELATLAADLERPLLAGAPLPPDQINMLLSGCNDFHTGLENLKTQDPKS
jgi:chemotaxis protein histidine kinase CheA